MLSFKIRRKTHKVATLAQARVIWEEYRDATGKGVSEIGNGVVVNSDFGVVAARISYNGRMWNPDGTEIA